MKKIYISGQITGLEIEEAEALFSEAEKHLLACDFEVVNPMTIEHNHDKSWGSYMRADLIALMDCDTIYMLNNWTKSKGAEIERKLALDLSLSVTYQR